MPPGKSGTKTTWWEILIYIFFGVGTLLWLAFLASGAHAQTEDTDSTIQVCDTVWHEAPNPINEALKFVGTQTGREYYTVIIQCRDSVVVLDTMRTPEQSEVEQLWKLLIEYEKDIKINIADSTDDRHGSAEYPDIKIVYDISSNIKCDTTFMDGVWYDERCDCLRIDSLKIDCYDPDTVRSPVMLTPGEMEKLMELVR